MARSTSDAGETPAVRHAERTALARRTLLWLARRRMPAIGIGPPISERTGGPPPQIRTCGFPASGSSKTWVRYAPATAVAHPEVQQPGSRLACSAIRPSLVDTPDGSLAPGIFPSSESTSPMPPLPPPAPSGRLPGFTGTTEALYHPNEPSTTSLPRRRVAHGEQLVGLHRFLGDPVPGLPRSSTPAEPVCPVH